MSTPANSNYPPPSTLYQHLLDSSALEFDKSQQCALQELDRIFRAQKQIKPGRTRNWARLGFFRSPAQEIKGCYLWGGVGTGKTRIMDIFYNSLAPGMATRTHFHRFMRSIHEQKKQIRHQQDPLGIIAMNIAQDTRVLCLDEFTVSDITDAMIMSSLLSHLFERGMILVTTSNSPPGELYRDGLQRARFLPAIHLLETHTISVHVDSGNDYRMAFLSGNDILHVPDDTISQNKLGMAFEHLAGTDARARDFFEINGRNIKVIAWDAGVVWFAFDDICRSHRSNSDFIEIAKQFHTVIISHIPVLDLTSEDAARRFIELVDELYDRNVNLLASSANMPNDIYHGKKLARHFMRTASRLTEMASNEYLAKPHLSR